jgi:hypothetical protein
MIARSKSSEVDSDVAARKGPSIESERSSLVSCCIRWRGSRYLDGTEGKVKEVVLRTLLINAGQIGAAQWFEWWPREWVRRTSFAICAWVRFAFCQPATGVTAIRFVTKFVSAGVNLGTDLGTKTEKMTILLKIRTGYGAEGGLFNS